MSAPIPLKMGKVRISVDENARLQRASQGRELYLQFGHAGVFLHPDCTWPLPLLGEWRGHLFNEGAGI